MIPPELWDRLAGQNAADVARRTKARARGDGVYEVEVLNEVYRIDAGARDIRGIVPSVPAEPDLSRWLATVAYLVEAEDVDPGGEWVSPRQFPGGYEFFQGPHEIPVGELIARFGADRDGFEGVCQRLGGCPEPYADAAYSFFLFPRFPVAVLLWLQDEEFPARVSMLVDRTAHRHFPLDALLAALGVMQNALIAAASAWSKTGDGHGQT